MAGGPSFRVVYEDRDLIVVDKAPGVLTVPTPRGERNTLLDLLGRYLERPGSRPSRSRHVTVIHRLDRDTSGLLVFAKDPRLAEHLRAQFRNHTAERTYLAIVAGIPTADSGTFDTYIATNRGYQRYSTGAGGADGDDRPPSPTGRETARSRRRPPRGGAVGERAITHFRVVTRGRDASLVEARLETGRRNQIRVHFAEAGHPVLGDPRYGREGANHRDWPAERLALHAAELGFVHPTTGRRERWTSPLPGVYHAFLVKQARAGEADPEERRASSPSPRRTRPPRRRR